MIFCFEAGQKFPSFDLEDSRKGEIELKEDILRTCCKLSFRVQLPRYLYLGGLGSGGGAEVGEGIGNMLQFSGGDDGGGYNDDDDVDDDDGYVDDDKVIMNDNYEKEHRVDKQRRGSA